MKWTYGNQTNGTENIGRFSEDDRHATARSSSSSREGVSRTTCKVRIQKRQIHQSDPCCCSRQERFQPAQITEEAGKQTPPPVLQISPEIKLKIVDALNKGKTGPQVAEELDVSLSSVYLSQTRDQPATCSEAEEIGKRFARGGAMYAIPKPGNGSSLLARSNARACESVRFLLSRSSKMSLDSSASKNR